MRFIKKYKDFVALLIFLIGVCLLAYPSFSSYLNSQHQTKAIAKYVENSNRLDETKYKKIFEDAISYNVKLGETGINWRLSAQEKSIQDGYLKVDSSGIISYIEIPDIDCYLPIYHGTEESVLQVAVGHVDGSSLPVGGESSHCVLSGHRGLPSAKLFTDLDQLTEGDVFLLHTLNETLTYEVDQICVVEPEDFSKLEIVEGEDYCTLVTCTPYGINTHRLLVRGRRITNVIPQEETVSSTKDFKIEKLIYILPLLILMLVIVRKVRKRYLVKNNH